MKMSITTLLVIAVMSLSYIGHTQDAPPVPKYVSEKGYWVVESNIKDKKNHVIWFYNNDDQVVYKETLTGVKLNTSRKKVRMKLKTVLESAVTAWEKANSDDYPREQGMVRVLF
jgi:hypothetical protein